MTFIGAFTETALEQVCVFLHVVLILNVFVHVGVIHCSVPDNWAGQLTLAESVLVCRHTGTKDFFLKCNHLNCNTA